MVKYNLAKVYKIVDNTTDNIYIGSTCEPTLARRLAGHVSAYKRYLLGKGHYITSFKILENDDYDIVLMADTPCQRKDQLHHIESHYIRNNDCVNKVIPNRTQQEYHRENKEHRNEISRKYHQNNKEKLHVKKNQRNDCCCGSTFSYACKARHIKTIKHQQYINNKIEQQYQLCVELFKSTKHLNIH
jgi:hypothetical protein